MTVNDLILILNRHIDENPILADRQICIDVVPDDVAIVQKMGAIAIRLGSSDVLGAKINGTLYLTTIHGSEGSA